MERISRIAWAIAATLYGACLLIFLYFRGKQKAREDAEKKELENKLENARKNLKQSLENEPENIIEHSRLRGIVKRLQVKLDEWS